jgi:hypothetical protein
MDGRGLTQAVLDCLDTNAPSDLYASQRRIYESLDQASGIFCRETMILRKTHTITTEAGRQSYDLPPDFINLYIRNRRGRHIIKYYDGSNTYWPVEVPYDDILFANLTDYQEVPNRFSIIPKETAGTLITGTATTDGAKANGQCILEDTTKDFRVADKIYPRDLIHNLGDNSSGYVLSVQDATHLVTALFRDPGKKSTSDDWTLDDAYTIQPAVEKTLYIEAPSNTAGHIITIPSYICMPNPVFSDFGFWLFPPRTCKAIAYGGASVFKVGKKEYKESAQIGGFFTAEIKALNRETAIDALRSSRRQPGR